MRLLYIDIDSLRPDHLGCYGYHRDTSPNIDRIAEQAVRFDNVYITDAPCLPSRTALWSGRCGFRTGVVNHGGEAATPFNPGQSRRFRDQFGTEGWMACLRNLGMKTVTISSFGERHSAWHWYAGFNEIHNPGYFGMDSAEQVEPIALDWLERNGTDDNWFLHVNLWDPHTPFRVPQEYGDPFADDPLPDFFTGEMWQRSWDGYGPHSPQEPNDFHTDLDWVASFPRHLRQIDGMDAVRKWVDGYDTGVRYADDAVGRIVEKLQALGIYEETVVVIGADHGENIGELNIWGDHQTADQITCRVPLLIRWPGLTDGGRVDRGLYQHYDWAATTIELLGGNVPGSWDGESFAAAFRDGTSDGREYVATSQGAWSVQRGIRWNGAGGHTGEPGHAYMLLETYHDGYKMLDDVMLFDLTSDPHETQNLAGERADVAAHGLALLADWKRGMMQRSDHDVDPLATVLQEGGALHTRGRLRRYIERLKATGREQHAAYLAVKHPREARE